MVKYGNFGYGRAGENYCLLARIRQPNHLEHIEARNPSLSSRKIWVIN